MPYLKHLSLVFVFALLAISLAAAQTVTMTEAARQVYQANLTQEAIKAQMDAELHKHTGAIDALSAQLRSLKHDQAASSKVNRARASKDCVVPPKTHAETMQWLNQGKWFCSHTDIVVEIAERGIEVIGGNVQNSVPRTRLATDADCRLRFASRLVGGCGVAL